MGQTDRKNPHVRSSKRPSLYKTRYNTYPPPTRQHLPPPPPKKKKERKKKYVFCKGQQRHVSGQAGQVPMLQAGGSVHKECDVE